MNVCFYYSRACHASPEICGRVGPTREYRAQRPLRARDRLETPLLKENSAVEPAVQSERALPRTTHRPNAPGSHPIWCRRGQNSSRCGPPAGTGQRRDRGIKIWYTISIWQWIGYTIFLAWATRTPPPALPPRLSARWWRSDSMVGCVVVGSRRQIDQQTFGAGVSS